MDDDGLMGAQRPVVRAACLNCRSAKRRCDGATPVCGPCASRGIEEGGCNFVSSKRGGPRYKGVKGADAAKIKAERDRAREEERLYKDKDRATKAKVKRERSGSGNGVHNGSTGAYGGMGSVHTDSGSSASQASGSPSRDWQRNSQSFSASSHRVSNPSQPSYSPRLMPSTINSYNGSVYGTPASLMAPTPSASYLSEHQMRSPADAYQHQHHALQRHSYSQQQQPHHHQHTQQQPQQPQQSQPAQQPISSSVSSPFGPPMHALPGTEDLLGLGAGEMLSFANLELWQRIQERSNSVSDIGGQMADFYSRLEVLPRAGIIGAAGNMDPLDVLMDWEGGETGGNVQDSEIGVRTLLSDFYDLVYPACPVLPSPGNLPSLAFYFSGKGPCGLFAAISAVVALHLSNDEAYKTLKASQHPLQRYEGSPTDRRNPMKPAEDVAAYHAKTSEFILHQWTENKRTCFMDPTATNLYGGMDEELITIEAGAAHTLLCLYYYGSGKPLSHQRAYKHAVEGWNLMKNLDIYTKSAYQINSAMERTNGSRPFAAEIKLEWAKRVHWCTYASATVMSCTGGFAPFGHPKDGALDLQVRPALEDVTAWGVMVRGAQQVSKAYRLLYELDQLRARVTARRASMNPVETQQATAERQSIFNAMVKLDTEISNYTRFDAGWRDPPPEPGVEGVKTADKELARSLKAAGRLMTSGAIILLHRAQAFSNARVFMEPQCGIPEAARLNRQLGTGSDTIMHHAEMQELPPPRLNHASPTEPPKLLPPNGMWPTERIDGGNSFARGNHQPSHAHLQRQPGFSANVPQRMQMQPPTQQHYSQQPQQPPPPPQSPPHPFLTDRFAGGPFEPAHSLERCQFAASVMVGTLPRMLQDDYRVPKLPPYSACSYVLGAYAILMLTLLIQVRSEMAVGGSGQGQTIAAMGSNGKNIGSQQQPSDMAELRMQLELYRAPVRDIIGALKKFAVVWGKAVEYENEVSTLLAANEILG